MTLVLLTLVAAVAVGLARGGAVGRLAGLRPRRNRLLLTALGLYALGALGSLLWPALLPAFAGLFWAGLAYYAWVNRIIPGATLVAAGLAANALVLLVNGHVPVSPDAAGRAGVDPADLAGALNHEPIGPDTRLAALGKTVPVAFPPRPEVVSPGDVAVAAGLAAVIATGLTRRRQPRNGPDETAEHETMVAEPEPEGSTTT